MVVLYIFCTEFAPDRNAFNCPDDTQIPLRQRFFTLRSVSINCPESFSRERFIVLVVYAAYSSMVIVSCSVLDEIFFPIEDLS